MATRDEQEIRDWFLTEVDLARRWKVSIKTLQNARVAGTGLRFVKLGHAVRYRLDDVELFEAASIRSSTSDQTDFARDQAAQPRAIRVTRTLRISQKE